MSHHTKLLILFSAVLPLVAIAAPPALADDPATAAADTAQVDEPTVMPVIDTQLAREVRAVQTDFNGRLAELTARYQVATDQTVAAAIQAEIVQLKQDLEVQMLTVQLREARRRGETAQAELIAELQEAIAIVHRRQGGPDGEVVPHVQDPQPAAPAPAAR
jgi:hypothetical protein